MPRARHLVLRTVQLASLAALALACRSARPGASTPPSSPDASAASPTRPTAATPRASGNDGRQRPAPETHGDPEPGRLAGITAAHNRVRAGVGVAPLEWSPELARYARRWADKLKQRGCRLEHRPGSGPDAQRHGENLYSGTGHAPTAAEVVDLWAAEVAGYDAKRNRCKGVCGHYTQVVWRGSQRLGCAMAACGATEVWVCNYDPPGNYVGERPY